LVDVSDLPEVPAGYILNTTTPYDPVLPAYMFDGYTLIINLDVDSTQTITVLLNYYVNDAYASLLDDSITVSGGLVDVSDLPEVPAGYILNTTTPYDPVLPAHMSDGHILRINLDVDTSQSITVLLNYYVGDTYAPLLDDSITVSGGLVDVSDLPEVPAGYILNTTPYDPTLPAYMSDGYTLIINLDIDSTQTITVLLNYYVDGNHALLLDDSITVAGGLVDVSDLPEVPAGYVLNTTTPYDPTLPNYFGNNDILRINLDVDSTQTITVLLNYYVDGNYAPLLDDSITVSGGLVDVSDLPEIPADYILNDRTRDE
jgi:hypothetical protein